MIIDLVDNTGGDMITTWGALFIDEPFQDQWVQFKNITELSDPRFRDDSLYKDKGKANALESLSPNWKGKDFYPPVPQFCADEKDCLKTKWPSRNKGFKGRYTLLTDPWCISSCVGFAWTLKNALKSRVFFVGIPDSGDSTYARAYIDGGFSRESPFYEVSVTSRPGGSKTKVKNGFIFRQAVSISRSTDENGEIISALPQRMDRFVGTRWGESPDEWVARLIKVALGFETIKISSKSFEFEFSDKDEADLFKKEINGIESKSTEIRKILAVQSKKKVWVKVSPFQLNPTFKSCARIYGKNEIYVHSLKSLAVSDSKTSGIDAYCFSKKSEDLIHSVLHEYAHSVNLSKLDGEDRPLKWIWEGIAQYLSGEMQSRLFTDSISKRFDQSQVVDFCNASIPDEISYGGGALFIREFAKINADAVSELSTKIKESDVAAYLKDLGVDCKQDLFSLQSGQPLKKVTQ